MHHDRVVMGADGSVLFRVRQQRASVMFIVPVQKVVGRSADEIERSLTHILQCS
jgi:hypothetical protein